MLYFGEFGFTDERLDQLHTDIARWHAGRKDEIPVRKDLTDAHETRRDQDQS